jgi:predicted transcriptional regulator
MGNGRGRDGMVDARQAVAETVEKSNQNGVRGMKAILISVRPEWAEKILNGEKTIEVRKTAPTCKLPMPCYVYETKNGGGRGAIVGVFMLIGLRRIYPKRFGYGDDGLPLKRACLSNDDLAKYCGTGGYYYFNHLCGWEIRNPETFRKPKPLSGFGLKRPPQSWRYIEV